MCACVCILLSRICACVPGESLLVINIDVKDRAEEAAIATPLAIDLCKQLDACDDWEEEVVDILEEFEKKTSRRPIYTIAFY